MDLSIKSNQKFIQMTKWMIVMMVLIIPIQVAIFITSPMPENGLGFITLMHDNRIMGLLHMDLLYIVNNTFLIFFYVVLYMTLKDKSNSLLNVALITGLVGAILYYTSNRSVEMLLLSERFYRAEDISLRMIYIGMADGYLDVWKGTTFNTYYFLSAISLILYSVVMIKSSVYNKKTGIIGLISGMLMAIPSGFGMIGLVMSLLSLVPWVMFCVLVVVQLHQFMKKC